MPFGNTFRARGMRSGSERSNPVTESVDVVSFGILQSSGSQGLFSMLLRLIMRLTVSWSSSEYKLISKSIIHMFFPGVMPPDEDHYPVNNSAYTNVIAGYAVFFAK